MQDVLGGSEVQCDIIARKLTELGHELIFIAVNSKKDNYDFPYQVIPLTKFTISSLYSILKTLKGDIVYWRFNKNKLLISAFIIKITGSKLVFSISAISDTKVFIHKGESLYRNIKKIILTHKFPNLLKDLFVEIISSFKNFFNFFSFFLYVDGIVSNNRNHLDKMQFKSICKCPKLYIPNSVLPVGTKFEWSKPFIVWVSNIKSKKNPEEFFKLSQVLTNEKVDFLMIGKIQDAEYEWLNDYKNQDRDSNFYYLGQCSIQDVFGIINKSLFLVHTCDREGFPNNFIQSWILGKPTISLYYDPEGVIEKNNIGLFSRDFNGLIRDTKTLINDDSLRLSQGKNALTFAHKRFNPDINVRTLERFMRNIIS